MKPATKTLLMILILAVLLVSAVSALTIESVTSNPNQIEPGEVAKLSLNIENNLGEDIKNIIVSLDLSEVPFAPYQSSSQQAIEELEDNEDEKVNFEIIALAKADSGVYKIPVKISYNSTEKTSFISLTINAKPKLRVDYEGTLIKGKNNDLSIKIINSGLSDVKLLSAEISNVLGLQILTPKYIYIGDLDSDDFDVAEFKVFIKENAPGLINLPVKINYRDSTNKEINKQISLSLKTYTKEEAVKLGLIKKDTTLIYIFIIVGLILIYIIYRKIKKRRRLKRAKAEIEGR